MAKKDVTELEQSLYDQLMTAIVKILKENNATALSATNMLKEIQKYVLDYSVFTEDE